MPTSITAKRGRLAAAIERDILGRNPRPIHQSQACFGCGRSYHRQNHGRFCSGRCREAFDAGVPAYEPLDVTRFYSLPIGPKGFFVECAHCRKRFESKGLRCCSSECERELRRKQELEAKLADDPFRVVKRKCESCGGPIPNWRNGRRVSNGTKFCSRRCQRKAAKGWNGLREPSADFGRPNDDLAPISSAVPPDTIDAGGTP
jgi:hypothetical protein